MKRQVTHFLLLLISAASLTACEPDAIAPLPSPVAPDDTRIFTSSLTIEGTSSEPELIAVVGMNECVAGSGDLRIVHTETDTEHLVATTDTGSFSTTLKARPGDSLTLQYINSDGVESEAVTIAVPSYEPTQRSTSRRNTGEPDESNPAPPSPPKVYEDAQENCVGSNCVGGTDNPETDTDTLNIDMWVENGVLYLSGDAGFATADSRIILTNLATGQVAEGQADSEGALDIHIPAKQGDKVALFSHHHDHHNLTSPAVLMDVP
jgi:hypothetical protein